MAKPIEATPTLRGEDAKRFIRNMIKTEKRKITKKEKELFRAIMMMEDGVTPRCQYCYKAMKNYTPTKGKFKGQVQKYSWVCDCPTFPKNIVISVG